MAESSASRRSKIFLGERHTSLFSRGVAKLIDGLVVIAIYLLGCEFWHLFGVVVAMLYCGAQDSFWMGQSVGKRIMGLRVIDDHLGVACSFQGSFLRNSPFVVVLGLLSFPVTWVFGVALGIPFLILEIYLVTALDSGVRLGDILGNTLVVEYLDDGLAAPVR